MSNENPTRKPTKEEIMEAIRRCAAKLGHPPTHPELREDFDVSLKAVQKLFGTYINALRACELDPEGAGYRLTMEKVFAEWARIVRETGKIPTVSDFQLRSKYSIQPLRNRFSSWKNVPAGMLQYAQEKGLQEQWGDVMEITKQHFHRLATQGCTSKPEALTLRPRVLEDRPVYGASLVGTPMAYAPTSESGVMVLFGALAMRLGFTILWVGTSFPDCEAVRQIEPGRWQRVLIEFEYQSRNFVLHGHDPAGCDMVVCWEHNWPECPVEVVELRQYLNRVIG